MNKINKNCAICDTAVFTRVPVVMCKYCKGHGTQTTWQKILYSLSKGFVQFMYVQLCTHKYKHRPTCLLTRPLKLALIRHVHFLVETQVYDDCFLNIEWGFGLVVHT